MAYGVEKPASSASCHPSIRSPMLSNRLVHNASGDENDEGASTFIGSLLPFLFFLLSYHTYHCSTRGNLRLIDRLMMQVEHVLVANQLQVVTKEVVETARE